MIKVDVRDAIGKLDANLGYAKKDARNLAIARAINHTIAKAKTLTSREIRNLYSVDASTLGKALTQVKADRLTLTGKIIARGRPISLARYKARQTRQGVTVEVLRGKRKLIPGVFLANLKSGYKGVMVRGKHAQGKIVRRKHRVIKSGNDLPITSLAGVSIPKQLANKIILRSIEKGINETFPQRLSHEIKRVSMPY